MTFQITLEIPRTDSNTPTKLIFLHRNLVPKQMFVLDFVLYSRTNGGTSRKPYHFGDWSVSVSIPSPKIQEEDGILFLYVILQYENSECL